MNTKLLVVDYLYSFIFFLRDVRNGRPLSLSFARSHSTAIVSNENSPSFCLNDALKCRKSVTFTRCWRFSLRINYCTKSIWRSPPGWYRAHLNEIQYISKTSVHLISHPRAPSLKRGNKNDGRRKRKTIYNSGVLKASFPHFSSRHEIPTSRKW